MKPKPWTRFLNIEGFPGYAVGDDGSVWSCWTCGPRARMTDHWRRLSLAGSGRKAVSLCKDGRRFTRRIYRLVLEAFVGPCPPGLEACHDDDDQSNNRLSNLRWGTHKSNCADRSRNGKHPVGSKHKNAKYTELQILWVKNLLHHKTPVRDIVELTGVGRATVYTLKKGIGWVHTLPA